MVSLASILSALVEVLFVHTLPARMHPNRINLVSVTHSLNLNIVHPVEGRPPIVLIRPNYRIV